MTACPRTDPHPLGECPDHARVTVRRLPSQVIPTWAIYRNGTRTRGVVRYERTGLRVWQWDAGVFAAPVTSWHAGINRHGDTWHGASLIVHGQRGGFVAALSLHRSDLRELASAASLTADWIDARERGEAGPCLCHAWRHGPAFPCPNRAADDSTYCRTCWTPDEGMQGHEERWA